MLDHGTIRGDHLTELDAHAVNCRECGYTDEAAAYEISWKLAKLGYGRQEDCIDAARKVVAESRNPREANSELRPAS